MAYVTVEAAAAHLRLDLETDGASPPTITDDRRPDLELKIAAAEAVIIDYLKYAETGWDEETIPLPIKASMLLLLGAMWEDREGKGEYGDLLTENGAIASLLRRFRDPALA